MSDDDDDDDDDRGIKDKGLKVTVVKGTKESGHDEFGGSLEELNMVKNRKIFIKWQDQKLIKVTTRPTIKGVTYFTINHKNELHIADGYDVGPRETLKIRDKIEKTFKIKLSTSKNSFQGVDIKAFKGKYRGYATTGTLTGVAGAIGVAGGVTALVGGLDEAIEWLEFPEQIDAIKKSKIDPMVVKRALYAHQLKSLHAKAISRLAILNEVENNNNVPTNILIDPETGVLYCVVLEATKDYELGQIVGIKQLRFYDKVNNYRIYRDYEMGLTYAFLPGEGWLAVHFRFNNLPQ